MPFDMKSLTLDAAAATSSTVLFGAIGGQTDSAPTPIPINILGTYIQANFAGSGANPTASVGLAAVNGSATTFLRSDGAPALSQAIAPTWTGQHIFNLNGAASTPPALINGTWFTSGSATTTKPQLLVEPSGTTSTGWSTHGTGIGANAASGFTGNLIDLQLAGTSMFNANGSTGTVTISSGTGSWAIVPGVNNAGMGGSNLVSFAVNDNATPNGIYMTADRSLCWSSANAGASIPNTADTVLSRGAAGVVKFGSAGSFSANSNVATVLGSVGPAGSNTTVQKWLTIVDSGGATRYIPCF